MASRSDSSATARIIALQLVLLMYTAAVTHLIGQLGYSLPELQPPDWDLDGQILLAVNRSPVVGFVPWLVCSSICVAVAARARDAERVWRVALPAAGVYVMASVLVMVSVMMLVVRVHHPVR